MKSCFSHCDYYVISAPNLGWLEAHEVVEIRKSSVNISWTNLLVEHG